MEGLFTQTENQLAIVETVRRFVEAEIVPRAAAFVGRKTSDLAGHERGAAG